ncbi:MAG: ABC transporter substrate-binding protein [Anaerocolumna sp.]
MAVPQTGLRYTMGRKMRVKKMIALFLSAVMTLGLLTGCSSGNTAATGSEGETAGGDTEKPYTVTIYAPYDAKTGDCDAVSEAVSKITRELINCDVEVIRGMSSEQLNLALTSGEKMDLFYAFPWELSLSSMAASNQIVPLDDLLAEHGADTLSAISDDDWQCVTVDGKIYGIPMNKDKAQARGFLMAKDIADEVGIDYSVKKTYAELEEDLTKVKEAYPDLYPIVPNAGSMMIPIPSDTLGDSLGVLPNCLTDSTKVVNLFDSDEYKEYVSYMYKWSQDGIMMPDAANTTESYDDFIRSGVGFGTFTPIKAGFEAEETRKCGTDIVAVELYEAHSTTTMVNASWCVANNSEKPDKAVEMLNLMYTNPEISNLLINGMEGTHYKVVDADKNIIDYADGLDSSSTGYSSVGWAWPNEQITSVWNGSDPNVWEELSKFNASAKASPAKGFAWNNANVLNEVTACQNVVNKYENSLDCGCLDPEVALPQMNEDLKAAGIEKIMEEKQAQLDAWLADKK